MSLSVSSKNWKPSTKEDKDRRLSRIQRLRRRLSCSFGRLSLSKEVILPDGENECAFVRATADCGANDAWLAYTAFAYCGPLAPYLPLAAEALWLALLFLVLGTTADDFLCPALVVVSRTMRLSESVAGVTLLAFGNGAPDIISSLAGVEQSRPALVVGELLGAGTFVTAVVAGTVFLLCRFSLEPAPFLRDAVFYLGASFWTFWLFYAGAVTLGHAVGFLALYGSYIAVVLAGHILRAREEQQRRLSVASSGRRSSTGSMHRHHEHAIAAFMQASHEAERRVSTERVPLLPPPADPWAEFLAQLVPWDPAEWAERSVAGKVYDVVAFPLRFALVLTVPVVDYADARDNWCRPLNTLHCITAPVFAVAVLGFEVGNAWALAALAGAAVALLVWFSSSFESAPRYHFAFGYAGFALSVLWIYGVARELLGLLRTLGLVAAVSDAVLGLTVLAWGNSLGDLVTNVAVARQGYPSMAMAACFGGPLLNLLMGVGLPYTVRLAPLGFGARLPLTLTPLVCTLYSALVASLLLSLYATLFSRYQASRIHGAALLALYALFLAVALTVEVKFS